MRDQAALGVGEMAGGRARKRSLLKAYFILGASGLERVQDPIVLIQQQYDILCDKMPTQ